MFQKFSREIDAAIAAIQEASTKAEESLKDIELTAIRQRVVAELKKIEKNLLLNSGRSFHSEEATEGLGKVTSFLGRSLENVRVAAAPLSTESDQVNEAEPAVVKQFSTEAEELRDTVNRIYESFSDMSNDEILDSLAEIEIRGVGRKAGLPVTETSPKKVDTAFVKSIKEAIAKKAELDATKAAATSQAGETKEVDNPLAESDQVNEAEPAVVNIPPAANVNTTSSDSNNKTSAKGKSK